MWLKEDGLSRHDDLRVSCFIINCLTVVSSAALVTADTTFCVGKTH